MNNKVQKIMLRPHMVESVTCPCGGERWQQVFLLKKIKAIFHPAGIEEVSAFAVYQCIECGAIDQATNPFREQPPVGGGLKKI